MSENMPSESENAIGSRQKSIIVTAVLFMGIALVAIAGLLLYSTEKKNDTVVVYEKNRPNIVLIVMDAFRADKIGATRNGELLTPFLSSLKRESVFFENAITSCTWTRPAITSLFTSLHMDTHQVYYGVSPVKEDLPFSDVLPEELQTMATYLKEVGYTTHAVQTNGQLSADFGYNRGFDSYVFLDSPPGEQATASALSLIPEVKSPFFLYVHYMDTHTPYNPPKQYLDAVGYTIENLPKEEGAIVENFKDYFWDHSNYVTGRSDTRKYEELSPEAKACVISRYDAEVRYCDEQVRHLVTSIKETHPETIFIITADHGEHLWDHDYLGHGLTMYDCELRIPLLLLSPSLVPAVVEKPVSLIGILPTVSALLDAPRYSGWQGIDLLEEGNAQDAVFSYSLGPSPGWNTDVEAVISSGMKFIRDKRRNTEELYAWLEDSKESQNLAGEMPDSVAQMCQQLEDHRRENIDARRSIRQQTTIDEETIERMRRLGYME